MNKSYQIDATAGLEAIRIAQDRMLESVKQEFANGTISISVKYHICTEIAGKMQELRRLLISD